tara:strand:- start:1565 stop:2032 length:468 start_codon:yes stop_codon:yes gene_type:complete
MRFATILVGALVVEACMNILLTQITIGDALTNWYKELKAIAIIMDVISIAVGTWLGMHFTKDKPWYIRAIAVVLVQLTHDITFSLVLPYLPSTPAINLFRSYAKEVGVRILFYDALIMLSCFGASHALQSLSDEQQYVIGATAAYIALLMLPITK